MQYILGIFRDSFFGSRLVWIEDPGVPINEKNEKPHYERVHDNRRQQPHHLTYKKD